MSIYSSAVAYTDGALYIRLVFDLQQASANVDVATFGIHALNSSNPGEEVLDDVAAMVADQWNSTLGNSSSGWFASFVKGRSVDVYRLGADGKTTAKGQAPLAFGGGGTTGLPWQDSMVVSLYDHDPTGFQARPGRHRGRFYLPPFATTKLQSDGTLSTSNQTLLKTDAAGFIQGIKDTAVGTANINPQIQSKTDQAYREVKYVRVGRVVDTVRSRRNKLQEAYVQQPIT